VGNPEGPRSLAAPHRMRSLLPLGRRVESCPLGWCGPAKPLRPPRFHTFPHQILIHRCTPRFGSTTSRPTPPPPSQASCAAVVFCCVCGIECGPDMQYNKCGSCLNAAFHAFAALHVPELVQHHRNSSPSIEGPAASAGPGAACLSSCGPRSAKRARRLSPPHRKAGPPN
jgi:hypothetical protein